MHEYAHAWTAYKLGDPTAKAYGRLTLNPLKHIDPIGLLALFVFKIGWAKPVPVNYGYLLQKGLKAPLRVVLAGPLSNVFLSVLGAVLSFIFPQLAGWFMTFSLMNLFLGFFNLLPIPPLDGGRVLEILSLKYRGLRPVVEFLARYYLIFLIIFMATPLFSIFSAFVYKVFLVLLYLIILILEIFV